jgi:prepilin-type N-terminal cleavage/methylation domain-containing protein
MLGRTSPPQSRRGGYTLIELLIVVAILGLAGAMLVPQLTGRDSLRVQAAVRQLIGDLSFAQSDALARQEPRRVHFYDDGRGYCLVRDMTAAPEDFTADDYIQDPLATSGELGRYIVEYPFDDRFEGVSISSVSIDGGGRDLRYDEIGGTVLTNGNPGTGGTIQLEADGEQYQITIAPFTGKLTVQKVGP